MKLNLFTDASGALGFGAVFGSHCFFFSIFLLFCFLIGAMESGHQVGNTRISPSWNFIPLFYSWTCGVRLCVISVSYFLRTMSLLYTSSTVL